MNKLIIPIIITVILAAGIGAFFIFQKTAFPEPPIVQRTQRDIISIASPFGASGAYSRPFVEGDDISREKVLQMVSELKKPYEHVQDIGTKWIRPGTDIGWNLVQPSPNHVEKSLYEWAAIDNLFYGKVPVGINTLATITVDQGIKSGTWEFINKGIESRYIQFVKELTERYDGDGFKDMPGLKNPIKYWQIENEPALLYVKNSNKSLDWQGFSHIIEITYNAIKESDPEAKVAVAGMAGGHAINTNEPLLKKEREEFYPSLLQNLKGKYVDIFDIHYYGSFKEWPNNWKGMKDIYNFIRQELDQNGYKNTEIWFTETALPSKPYGERLQAIGLIKRYIYPLSFGVKKVFWWNMIEGEYPLEVDKPSNHYGLVYDGIGKDDPGYGVRKLSYYTYKKMVEVLDGSDWNNIQTIQESDGVYIYKFKKGSKNVWVAWNDNSSEKTIIISGIGTKEVKITETVPKYESGKEVVNYDTAFDTEIRSVINSKVSFTLTESPVFIEEK